MSTPRLRNNRPAAPPHRTEVRHLDSPSAVEEDIARLPTAVQQSEAVRKPKRHRNSDD
jgi:hypothetical protein